ncbi:MAG: dockerin type I domain-containing protein [Clostridiales bacterium]|nr:dockerin type I domain-containing protein [Clostridiales bacterium]
MKMTKTLLALLLVLALTVPLVPAVYAEPAATPTDGSLVYIDDGVIRVTVDDNMDISVYRYDNGARTLMAGPVERMGPAGATALSGTPWANGIPWSTAAGSLNANSAKLFSLRSGYVTSWSQGGTGTNSDRLTHGNAQYETFTANGDNFVRGAATYETNVETWLGTGNRLTIPSTNADLDLTRKIVLETANALPGEVAYSCYYTYTGDDPSYKVTKFVESNLMIKEPVKPDRLTIGSYDRVDAGLWLLCGCPMSWGNDYLRPVFYDMGTGNAVSFNQTGNSYSSPNGGQVSKNNWNWGADAGFPLNDFYGTTIGLAIGSLMPYNTYGLEMPVRGSGLGTAVATRNNETAYTWMGWPGKTLEQGQETFIGTSLLAVHTGDYFDGAGKYSAAMDNLSAAAMVTSGLSASDVGLCRLAKADEIPDWSFAPSYETWGYGSGFLPANTMDILPELKALGIKSVTLDAGWYSRTNTEGEGIYLPAASKWSPVVPKLAAYFNEAPLPCTTPQEAVKVVARFIDYFHDNGIKVIAWVMPPNGRTSGTTITEHPNWFARSADGSTKNADGGNYRTLCTGNPEVLNEFTDYFVDIIFGQYGFDGIKGDSFYGVSPCYGADGKGNGHGHDGDIYANIKYYGKFFKNIYDKACLLRGATATLGGPVIDREQVPMMKNCMCGQPMDYYIWAGTNRPVPGDHVGSRTQRYLTKMYKGFYGASYMVDTDHIFLGTLTSTDEAYRIGPIDYISYIGAGGAMSTKYITSRFNTFSSGDLNANYVMRYPGQSDYSNIASRTGTYKWGDFVKWFGLSNDIHLSSRDTEMVNLYKYGLDYPEGYAYKQGSDFFYSFFATNNTVSNLRGSVTLDPWGSSYVSSNTYNGNIELRGLKPGASYNITNVENGKQYSGIADVDGNITLDGISFITGVIYKASETLTTSVSGTVTGRAGATIPGAELTLLDAAGNPVPGISTTAANLAGYYSFPVVPDGTYRILVTTYKGTDGKPYTANVATPYGDYMTKRFTVSGGETLMDIDVTDIYYSVSVRADAESDIDKNVELILSTQGAKNLLTVEAEILVDGNMLAGLGVEPLNGFRALTDIFWSYAGDGMWKGTVTLVYKSGDSEGFTSEASADIAVFKFAPRAVGDTVLTLTGAVSSGLDSDGKITYYFDTFIESGWAATNIDQRVFSKYDLNRDNKVDALDLGIMLLYCGFATDTPGWDTLVKVNDSRGKGVTASMCDVNSDGIIDMLDLLDLFIHYTK